MIDFLSSGERTGKSLNRLSTDGRGFGPAQMRRHEAEHGRMAGPKRVIVP